MAEAAEVSQPIGCYVDTREETNIRAYKKWINSKIGKKHAPVENLIEDLRDGRVLISLLEILLNKRIPFSKGNMRFHHLDNVRTVLNLLREQGLKLHFINSEAIVDGNKNSILGLIWMIILHFQVKEIVSNKENKNAKPSDSSPRKKSLLSQAEAEKLLLSWIQHVLQGFSNGATINDFKKSWEDGFAFIYLLHAFRPSAVDMSEAQKMSVADRLDYSFNVAEKEFGVPGLLESSEVEQGNFEKNGMLMYLSSLYEVLRNQEVQKTSLMIEPQKCTVCIGEDVIHIQVVSKNEIVLRYMKLYYTVLYSIKELEKRMKAIEEKEPCQESAIEVKKIQMEKEKLKTKIEELNTINQEMSKSPGVDSKEFSEIQRELEELNKRWSALLKLINKELLRQPAIAQKIVNRARYSIDNEVYDITSVSRNEIVLNCKVLYQEIVAIIEQAEKNIEIINDEKPSQKTNRKFDETVQIVDQLQEKFAKMNSLMSEMKDAENVDSEEREELQKNVRDFQSRLTRANDFISKNQITSAPETRTLNVDGEIIHITTISTNEIVVRYKILHYEILHAVKKLEKTFETIQKEDPSQENAKALRKVHLEMDELQDKLKELYENLKEMSNSSGVDRKEFLEIQRESEEIVERWSILVKHNNKEVLRQPAILRETKRARTSHSGRLTIEDEVIEVKSVSSNDIVIVYKITFLEIMTIIKLIEKNNETIKKEEPSQKTAALLDENTQRLDELQDKITKLNDLMTKMEVAENVDSEEFGEIQNEFKDFESRLSLVNDFITKERQRQPAVLKKTLYETSREEEMVFSLFVDVKLHLT
ncbi:spectrin beta chain, erythrocytic-like [Xenia sp. Carnegie-2017]|uniref:spectrin beta chain, erythrocytic-like n=1 Tax=Xenia sp. Carnegie-2017 TaxID=2897299 RepID=UPI001F04D677|nr:spectrin beta chain, erythrocytic-like [Xenia sp. Carnegie-2017]